MTNILVIGAFYHNYQANIIPVPITDIKYKQNYLALPRI